MCACLYLLQESLYDGQQDVPRHDEQLSAVLLDESCDRQHNLVGHHLIRAAHGLGTEDRGQTLVGYITYISININ